MSDVLTATLPDKLYRTKYEPDANHAHIEVQREACITCEGKPCLYFCPAEVYRRDVNDERHITISHENCLECGTCRYGCPANAIEWNYPNGGMGVKYRYG